MPHPDSTRRRVDTYLRSLVEHDTAVLEADIACLDRLVATESAAPADRTEAGATTIDHACQLSSGGNVNQPIEKKVKTDRMLAVTPEPTPSPAPDRREPEPV